MNDDLLRATTKKDTFTSANPIEHPYLTEENLLRFVQSDYYIRAWKKGTWNVGAFFLGAIWMTYRKMYLYAVLYITVFLLSAIVLPTGILSELIFPLLMAFILGGMGNRIYLKFAEKKIEKIMTRYSDPKMQDYKLKKLGGTTFIAPTIVLVILVIIYFLPE